MPRISQKQAVLNGRGAVVQYASGSSAGGWFYRELVPGTKSYRTRRIEGAQTLEEAVSAATDVAFQLNSASAGSEAVLGGVLKRRTGADKQYVTSLVRTPRSLTMESALGGFEKEELLRVKAGHITEETHRNKIRTLRKHLIPFLESKYVVQTNQIRPDSFQDYALWRANASPLSINREIVQIRDFLRNYLVRHRLMPAELLADKGLFRKLPIRQTDLMANPAINPEDWKLIIDWIRGPFRKEVEEDSNHKWHYWRTAFWHFALLLKNSGMSPEEAIKLKWKQIEFRNEPRRTSRGGTEDWIVTYINTVRSKTKQAREIPCNQGRELQRWLEFQRQYIKDNNISTEITLDTHVFGQPMKDWRPWERNQFGKAWIKARNAVGPQLKGHKFSKKPYTLYSLRSTFIEDHLVKGTDIFLLSRIAGHDVRILQRHYERMDIRLRSREITQIEFGKTKDESLLINPFE